MIKTHNEVMEQVDKEIAKIFQLLKDKNQKYGNSALDPIRIFSKADPVEQINVRIDDKLSRLDQAHSTSDDEDVISDLIGYLILLKVAKQFHESQIDPYA